MRVCRPSISFSTALISLLFMTFVSTSVVLGQGSYEAQVRGQVTDQSGAVVANANVSITNVATNITQTARTDEHGKYFFTGLRPPTYSIKADFSGFRAAEKTNIVLQVDQKTTVDFLLRPSSIN